jgi:hypothetical protein
MVLSVSAPGTVASRRRSSTVSQGTGARAGSDLTALGAGTEPHRR